jgi:hypothetical protein
MGTMIQPPLTTRSRSVIVSSIGGAAVTGVVATFVTVWAILSAVAGEPTVTCNRIEPIINF